MKPERLTELIKTPWCIKENDMSALRHVVENYPFFTTARLLYLYSAWKFDRINYDKHLADIPALSVSPLQINFWLNAEPIVEIHSGQTHQLHNVEDEQNDENDIQVNKKISDILKDEDEQNIENDTQANPADKKNKDPDINGSSDKQTADERDLLEKQIVQDTQKAINEWEIIVGTKSGAVTEEKKSFKDDIPLCNENQNEENKFNYDEKKNFLEWLKSCNREPINGNETEKVTTNDETKKFKGPSDIKLTDKRKKQWELLDKIIENEPGPIKLKTSESPPVFYQSERAARESLLESEEFVTETLANIYLAQGHYSKAIRVFEILSLKIPQKNAYFADKIKEIKNKLKSKEL